MIYIKMQGGLGNQMFEYAFAKALSLKLNDELTLDLSGITNVTHNVYSLNHFKVKANIVDNYDVANKKKIAFKVKEHFLWRAFNKNGIKGKYKVEKNMQWLFNMMGIYTCTDGYVKMYKSLTKDKYLEGYFQSSKYFDEYKDVIRKEFTVKDKVLDRNKKLLEKIKKEESVCIHIRRGDYTKVTNHLVCDIDYYKKAFNLMKSKVPNAKYYIFSDDIEWVKENIDFGKKVNYVEGGNPNYEELRLMYSCKHFIMSNSSFSFWAQYLSTNKKKVVIAPSKWFNDPNQICDIFEDSWIKIDV
nr:alpha-1,2-fucosyltransferase [Bacilli bacterium]